MHHIDAQAQENLRLKRAGHKVLVVDDEPASRYVTCRMLKACGYDTRDTGSGLDALSMAEQASAVVLDVNLPDMNGVQVCSTLRSQSEGRPRLPIVLHSAVHSDELHRGAGMASGADAYLVAPLKHEELIDILDGLLTLK